MEPFAIIQQFFARMQCQFCSEPFNPEEDVQLMGEGQGFFLVGIHCHKCNHNNGIAAVGMKEGMSAAEAWIEAHPEWSVDDIVRLSDLPRITPNDVLDAHERIQALDADWMQLIPEEIRERCTATDTE